MRWLRLQLIPVLLLVRCLGGSPLDGEEPALATHRDLSHLTLVRDQGATDITVYASGKVVLKVYALDGQKITTWQGSREEVKKLTVALTAAGWVKWKSKYPCESDDVEDFVLSIHWNGGSKSVSTCYDDKSAPKAVYYICTMIERMAEPLRPATRK